MSTNPHSKKKRLLHWQTFSILDYLFFAVLLAGFALRLWLLYPNFDVEEPDITNVYTIANHIVTYKEFPIIGEGNSIYTPLIHTPIYFYLIAAGLLVHNDIYTMAFIGIALQLVTIIILYQLAKTLFNPIVALISGVVLALNQQFIAQTHVMLQRWYEQPLFALSYLCLAVAYTKKNTRYVLYGAICFTFALGIGLHGYAALPMYVVISWIILRVLKAKRHTYVGIALASSALWLVMYAPVIHYLYKANHLLFAFRENVYVTSASAYACQLVRNTNLLLHGVFYSELFSQATRIFFSLLFFGLVAFALIKKHIRLTPPVIAMGIFIPPLITIAALLQKETKDYHFIAAFGPLILLLAYLAQAFGLKTHTTKVKTIICIAILILIGLPSTEFLQRNPKKFETIQDQRSAVQRTLPLIQEQIIHKRGNGWNDYTSIEVYEEAYIRKFDSERRYDPTHNTFWSIFEDVTGAPIAKTINGRIETRTHEPTDIVIICTDYETVENAQKNCVRRFLNRHPNFHAPVLLTANDGNSRYVIYHAQKNDSLEAPPHTKQPAGNTTCLLFGSH